MVDAAAAAGELLRRRRARASLADYATYIDPLHIPASHHRLLISGLEAVERGECDRLMVMMPPGSAKSTYASVRFPEWAIGRNPKLDVIAASHTQELAERFGRRVRNTVASAEFEALFGSVLSADSKAAGRWATAQGGEYFAAGVGGSITGRRADLAIIDDPVKSREDADSEIARENAWQWYLNDFLTRLKPHAKQVLIQTRWHEDDLAGRILEREADKWHVICLPMIAGSHDPLGRKPGERLWTEWFTDEMVQSARQDVRGWNALYQQNPAPEDGDFFQNDWFGEYDRLPTNLHFYAASDYAVTDGGGDYTEHGIFGVDWSDNLYVADWWRGQTTADEWIDRQCDLIIKHRPIIWFGESGTIRRSVEPFMLRRMDERRAYCRMEWIASIHDKATRARPIQARAAMGKIFFPKNAPWKADVLGQLLKFPAGKYDDAVDVFGLIGRGLEYVSAPRSYDEDSDDDYNDRGRSSIGGY